MNKTSDVCEIAKQGIWKIHLFTLD